MKIFLIGPVALTAQVDNCHAHTKAAAHLRSLGYIVFTPAEFPSAIANEANKSWTVYLRYSLRQLLSCDAVVLIHGYQLSDVAMIQYTLAQDLMLPEVRYELTNLRQRLKSIAAQFDPTETNLGCNLDDPV